MRVIEGEITLKTPLHIAAPGNYKVDDNDRLGSGKPLTRVVHSPFALKDPIIKGDGEDARSLSRIHVPTINANLLRGRIRRECANTIFESLIEREDSIPLSMAHILTCLSSSGQPSGDTVLEYDYIHKARNHLFAGIWGGGPNMLRSGIDVHNAVPLTDYLLDAGFAEYGARGAEREELAVTNQRNQLGETGLTYIIHFFKKDDVIHFKDELLSEVITDYEEALREHQEAVFGNRSQRKAEASTKKSDLDNMATMEAVMPGVSFTFRLEMDDHLSDAQAGLILLALERMKKKQCLGGWIRSGFGRFDFNYALYEDDNGSYSLIENEIVDDYKNQAKEAVNAITEKDLLEVYGENKGKVA